MNDVTLQPCGFTPDITCLMVLSFPAASMACRTTSTRPAVLRVQFFLPLAEPRDPAVQRFLRVLLGFQTQRFRRVEVLQPESRPFIDAERFYEFAGFHGCLTLLFFSTHPGRIIFAWQGCG